MITQEVTSREQLIGRSDRFLRCIREARRVAPHDVFVLLQGETGTGKELFAKFIHESSGRRSRHFVSVNCAALPGELMESEFFGHRRGAFTHAVENREGYVKQAHQGTLFLDEVSSLAPRLQAKLLRFLQEGEYRPVGAHEARVSDVRVIAASNIPLRNEIQEGRFREDLYYRLGVYILNIPPLRERPGDVSLLLEHFLERYAEEFGLEPPRPTPRAEGELLAYPWPGNVRELKNVVQRLVIQHPGSAIESLDGLLCPETAESRPVVSHVVGSQSFQEAKAQVIEQFECRYLRGLMEAHKGNVSQAARASGKHRRSLHELLKKHGIEAETYRE